MQITNMNCSQSFGKTPVMKCTVKNAETNRTEHATLYKMDTSLKSDYDEVMNSKNTLDIKGSFDRDFFLGQNYKQYYLLKNDKTDEVAGCAQTTKRMTRDLQSYTLIEEMSGNKKYKNATEPVFAYIVHDADKSWDDAVISAKEENIIPDMKKVKTEQTRTGEMLLSYENYDSVLNHSEKRYKIDYNV